MQPAQDNARNTIIFVVCAVAIFLIYDLLVLRPNQLRREAEQRSAQVAAEAQTPGRVTPPAAGPAPAAVVPVEQALAQSPRVPIETAYVRGSLSLTGARIDHLLLRRYKETLEEGSPNVELLRPEGSGAAFFADFGWVGANLPNLPGPSTPWRLAQGRVLTPSTPIVLTHDNGAGLLFTRRIAVDDRYMFTVTDTVANRSGSAATLRPYGSVQHQGVPPDFLNNQIIHEGAIGVLDGKLDQIKWNRWRKRDEPLVRPSTGGWLGITNKYWLAAIVPDQQAPIEGAFRRTPAGAVNVFDAAFTGAPRTLAPGAQLTAASRLFAGAKSVDVLNHYERQLGIPNFDGAVDWGNFWFLTRPLFSLLHFFQGLVGNFGVAIMLLTVAVKLLFFPLANKSFESMSKLKKLQPRMEEIKAKYGKDPAKQQQEIMAMYQKEKINPVMGCVPVLIQIPVWYALYKVLSVTLEMRHAPFFGYMKDLSARDPTTFVNLFGLLPFDPAEAPGFIGGLLDGPLHIGLLPLFYGVTMWLQQSMQPMSADPIQKQIFKFFPVIFTFIMAPFAVGLLVYWTWSNLLTILQQWVIMRRYKVENPIDGLIARVTGRARPAAAG
ncbi:MAG: membrane protein insertase YidC [Proteobacteria bacterium]|nr:membrane protein insertase YidC [Pseudomonadota bacterium]